MAKLVTKWRYLKPDAARHAQAYIRYIATREGVEKYVEENGARPAAQAQRVLVEKLLRDFPDARRSFEYEDYARRPTVRNASEFITRTLEEHPYLDSEYFIQRKFQNGMKRLSGRFKKIWRNQNGCCYHCGQPMEISDEREIFYKIPKSMGGKDDVPNMAYVHKYCQSVFLERRAKA